MLYVFLKKTSFNIIYFDFSYNFIESITLSAPFSFFTFLVKTRCDDDYQEPPPPPPEPPPEEPPPEDPPESLDGLDDITF